MKLGKREIDALTCSPGRRDMIVFDDELPGFGVRVTAAGAKTFLLQYQLGGRQGRRVRLVLGRYGEITPTQARALAEAERGKVRGGRDPAEERAQAIVATNEAVQARKQQAVADSFTFRVLIERWAEKALATRSATHRNGAPRAVLASFPRLLDEAAQGLSQALVQREVDRLTARAPVMARRARAYARAAFNWAERRRLVSGNPFTGVEIEGEEVSRARVLTDQEVGEVWRAAATLGQPFGPLVQLLLITLQRRGEVAGMRWDELAPDFATWTIPAERAKNGKAHIVHLAEPARAILREVPRVRGAPLVFGAIRRVVRPDAVRAPGGADQRAARSVSGFSKTKTRLFEAIEAERKAAAATKGPDRPPPLDWRLHDFRRTGVTVLARLGFPPHVADRLLNHVHGSGAISGVAAVYQRHEFLAEREKAIHAWAAHVLAVAAGKPAGSNVVELRRP